MAHYGDVIPITSRRHQGPPHDPPKPASRRGPLLPLLVVGLMIGSVIALGHVAGRFTAPEVKRATLASQMMFQRARADLFGPCATPAATQGPLRAHCVEQATSVLLFPDCDATCERAARAQLPQPTR